MYQSSSLGEKHLIVRSVGDVGTPNTALGERVMKLFSRVRMADS